MSEEQLKKKIHSSLRKFFWKHSHRQQAEWKKKRDVSVWQQQHIARTVHSHLSYKWLTKDESVNKQPFGRVGPRTCFRHKGNFQWSVRRWMCHVLTADYTRWTNVFCSWSISGSRLTWRVSVTSLHLCAIGAVFPHPLTPPSLSEL